MKYIIRSLLRYDNGEPAYFCAIHSFTPFFTDINKAKQFDSKVEAEQYALKELFTHKAGVFDIVEVK